MALNFPSSPALNDTHPDGTRTWRFDGISWMPLPVAAGSSAPTLVASSITAAAGGNYIVTATATLSDPASPSDGDAYEVAVRAGIATVGGLQLRAGDRLLRLRSGGTWANLPTFAPFPQHAVTTPEILSNVNTLTSSTQLSQQLLPGTYEIDIALLVQPSDVSRGTRARFHFSGTATAVLSSHLASPQQGSAGTTLDNLLFANRPAAYVFGTEWVEDSAQSMQDTLVLTVTAVGDLSVQFAQKFADPAENATLVRGHLFIRRIA
jgi:hypothetical protein